MIGSHSNILNIQYNKKHRNVAILKRASLNNLYDVCITI